MIPAGKHVGEQSVHFELGEDGSLSDIGLSSLIGNGSLVCELVRYGDNRFLIALTLEMGFTARTSSRLGPGTPWEGKAIRTTTIPLSRIIEQ